MNQRTSPNLVAHFPAMHLRLAQTLQEMNPAAPTAAIAQLQLGAGAQGGLPGVPRPLEAKGVGPTSLEAAQPATACGLMPSPGAKKGQSVNMVRLSKTLYVCKNL